MAMPETATAAYAELLEKNRRFLWNPFTQMKDYLAEEPVVVERGEGVKLIDVNGVEYYDGNSSLSLNIQHYNRPNLNQAVRGKREQVAHSTLLGMASVPAIELAERLVEITPARLGKVFYSDAGAAAVEIGLKVAFAYWRRIGRPEKTLFVAFDNGYHGDTIGSMSVGGIDLFHSEFGPLLFPCERVSFPHSYRFDGSEEECAQAILAALERLCREHDVLFFADEVATGFGRTGELFACEHEAVEPDIMTLGKGLTGGYLPVAATLVSDAIYDAFYRDFAELKALYHGHSFTGNQLGCAVALASLDLFEQDELIRHVQESSRVVARRLEPVEALPHVGDVRHCGLMIGIELVADRETKQPFEWRDRTGHRVCARARELGMLTRPLGDVVVFMPPLASEADDLQAMLSILQQAIEDVTRT